ncbi:hypothetical protein D9756_004972 [Leucocoprinus leucothites]|uniref:Uncharacterized protein n=1 Tax=Leucocoprinus leucothites TaxID=201217 RepID=A0A8H5G8Q9_9AGAR|nr:hypothetical protein D9756_004972 [Leucoagaricus leucothites]
MAAPSVDSLRPLRPPNFTFAVTPLPRAIWLVIAATLAAHAVPGANAYTWNLRSDPRQCQNMTIDLSGTGGQPPFRILIVPFGATPLSNNIEARKIQETVFARGNDRSGSVMLNYPANSQFVAVDLYYYCSSPNGQRSALHGFRRWRSSLLSMLCCGAPVENLAWGLAKLVRWSISHSTPLSITARPTMSQTLVDVFNGEFAVELDDANWPPSSNMLGTVMLWFEAMDTSGLVDRIRFPRD